MADKFLRLEFKVKNAPSGSNIGVKLSDGIGGPVVYSAGAPLPQSRGISIEMPVGVALPLNKLEITPTQVRLLTQSGDEGPLHFSVFVYLTAAPGVATFKLETTNSSPTTQIQVSVGGGLDQTLNNFPTTFEWAGARSNDS